LSNVLIGVIEAGVGAACVAIGWVALRRAGMRWFGFILVVAGLTALGHAGWSSISS
jgi:hypothetical protein